jgi:alpha-amylase/alpha-mannosidase (GH57 family)
MHQPWYCVPPADTYRLPWTYLHTIKDYVDMAAHLEECPGARAVVNFAPTLIEQIEDYAQQIRAGLEAGMPLRDPLLEALRCASFAPDLTARKRLVESCLRAHEQHVIRRFAPFKLLAELAQRSLDTEHLLAYLGDQYFGDLLMWYHLAWLGETVRRHDARVQRWEERRGGYTLADRRALLALIGELIGGVLPRYRRLAESGQIELSVTPYAHPILPLLLDVRAGRESFPDAVLPEIDRGVGGLERARWHLEEGIAVFTRTFGARPRGCWPAEGALSGAALELIGEAGFQWTASGQGVLMHSLKAQGHAEAGLKPAEKYAAYRHTENGPICFFRDDELSDLIGFSYSSWRADDAVVDLLRRLLNIRRGLHETRDAVVAIIMDGENAWENYPANAYGFLRTLYRVLAEHPLIHLSSFSECIASDLKPRTLTQLVAGSWIYGTLSTWIGDAEKNRAWELLYEAERAYETVRTSLAPARRAAIERQLAIVEGSDWFWWPGDYNPAATVAEFDLLFRLQLQGLYRLLGVPAPTHLADYFTRGGRANGPGGSMRPAMLST